MIETAGGGDDDLKLAGFFQQTLVDFRATADQKRVRGDELILRERRRMIGRPIATKKFCAVARPRGLASVEVCKRHAITKLAVPAIAGKQCSGCRVDFGDNERGGDTP